MTGVLASSALRLLQGGFCFRHHTSVLTPEHRRTALFGGSPVPPQRSSTVITSSSQPTASTATRPQVNPKDKWGWSVTDMPPCDGKVFIVTGSTSGLGYYCAKDIAARGGHVIVAARNMQRCEKAAAMIRDSGVRGKVEPMLLDLSSFRSVVNFAEAFKAKKLPLHVLVNNAGIFIVPHDHTEEGFEHIVGINYWGTFLLTHLLLDQLKNTEKSRVVMMSSLFEQLGQVPWDDLEGRRSKDSDVFEYCNSKIMMIMLGRELNKRLKASGVEVFSANPGIINTPLNRRKLDHSKFTGRSVDIFTRIYGQKTEKAAVCLTRPATDPALAGYGGAYFSPPWLFILAIHVDHAGMREPSNPLARDEAAWLRLYDESLHIANRELRSKNLGSISAA